MKERSHGVLGFVAVIAAVLLFWVLPAAQSRTSLDAVGVEKSTGGGQTLAQATSRRE